MENGGSGKLNDIPPSNFRADISDEKERKKEFVSAGRQEMKLSKEYLDWLGETRELFSASVAKRQTKTDENVKSELAFNSLRLANSKRSASKTLITLSGS